MQIPLILRLIRAAAIALFVVVACVLPSAAQTVPPLYGQGRTFSVTDHIVSTSVFHWFTSTDGQTSGPWQPYDGRANWTGEAAWWQTQIKQMMMANIDVMWVHLIQYWEPQRVNMFAALNQLRSQGYDVPKVAPFLDPMITWDGMPMLDLSQTANKDTFTGQYTRFFQQYYSVNQDAYADSYIEQIGGKVVLDTWHVKNNCSNLSSLTRSDVETRLAAAFGAAHPVFNNGIRMVTTAYNPPTLSFADEKVAQFEVNQYVNSATCNGVVSLQLKGGYWDQNIRKPGYCLKRNGGSNYKSAWNTVNRSTTSRVYIESWNELDEGSGVYAAATGSPYIMPGSGNTSTDTWSSTNDPYEYIHTTAAGAASFNDISALAAKVLWNNIPTQMRSGSIASVKVIMRNEGDTSWNSSAGISFGQDRGADPVVFCASDCIIDSNSNEIPTYGGIFHGRPIEFDFQVTAPSTAGTYVTHWGMTSTGSGRFGEQLPVSVQVIVTPVPTPARPTDAGVAIKTKTVRFDWIRVTDPVAGTAGYNCRVGTAPGGSDVYSGYVGNVSTKSITGNDGSTYYCQVQTVSNDGSASQWSTASDGVIVDTTSPSAPGTPTDAGFYTKNTSITFTWTPAVDSGSGIVDYICRIGTTSGGYDILNGSVGNVLSKTVTVAPRKTYYCRVVGKDAAGNSANWSATSDGIGVVDAADEPVGKVKSHADDTWIGLTLPISATFASKVYVQDILGLSGLAVNTAQSLQPGDVIGTYGPLATQSGERAISAVGVKKQ